MPRLSSKLAVVVVAGIACGRLSMQRLPFVDEFMKTGIQKFDDWFMIKILIVEGDFMVQSEPVSRSAVGPHDSPSKPGDLNGWCYNAEPKLVVEALGPCVQELTRLTILPVFGRYCVTFDLVIDVCVFAHANLNAKSRIKRDKWTGFNFVG